MNVHDGAGKFRQVPQCVAWGDGDYDGSERPVDPDVEEPPPWKPEQDDDERTPDGAKTPVLWC